jgi:hypothetical protein
VVVTKRGVAGGTEGGVVVYKGLFVAGSDFVDLHDQTLVGFAVGELDGTVKIGCAFGTVTNLEGYQAVAFMVQLAESTDNWWGVFEKIGDDNYQAASADMRDEAGDGVGELSASSGLVRVEPAKSWGESGDVADGRGDRCGGITGGIEGGGVALAHQSIDGTGSELAGVFPFREEPLTVEIHTGRGVEQESGTERGLLLKASYTVAVAPGIDGPVDP